MAKGFQERDQPQSDSPTAAKESFKLLVALATNQNFRVVSMDIRAAFLQAKKLDREVFVRPPDDIKKERSKRMRNKIVRNKRIRKKYKTRN